MWAMIDEIVRLGGIARTSELLAAGHDPVLIELAAEKGRIIRVRHGFYASANVSSDVLAAARVGGRLACVSALAHLGGMSCTTALHVAVPKNASRLRIPDDREVVIHWMRRPGGGTRQCVSASDAARQASSCRSG